MNPLPLGDPINAFQAHIHELLGKKSTAPAPGMFYNAQQDAIDKANTPTTDLGKSLVASVMGGDSLFGQRSSYKPEMSEATKRFLENETPAEREARMLGINNFLTDAARNLLPFGIGKAFIPSSDTVEGTPFAQYALGKAMNLFQGQQAPAPVSDDVVVPVNVPGAVVPVTAQVPDWTPEAQDYTNPNFYSSGGWTGTNTGSDVSPSGGSPSYGPGGFL